MSTRSKLGHLTTVAALFLLLSWVSLPVMTQEPAPPPKEEAAEPEEKAESAASKEDEPTDAEDVGAEEAITVVGTQIKGVDPVGSDPVVISHEEAQRTGLANTADIIRRLPQNQTAVGGDIGFQGGTANQGYNGAQIDTVNLRGLGASATLILVDGRRVVGQGAAATGTDANQIPLPALERLEVLVDGASAVYGSDAVAGVVNFVLRRDIDEMRAAAGTKGTRQASDFLRARVSAFLRGPDSRPRRAP